MKIDACVKPNLNCSCFTNNQNFLITTLSLNRLEQNDFTKSKLLLSAIGREVNVTRKLNGKMEYGLKESNKMDYDLKEINY